jgi:hypothetical protein
MIKKMRRIIKKIRKIKNMEKGEERWKTDEKAEIAEMMISDMMMTG